MNLLHQIQGYLLINIGTFSGFCLIFTLKKCVFYTLKVNIQIVHSSSFVGNWLQSVLRFQSFLKN